ncbi:MAG: Methyltransferase type 11, partial [Ilumatobacteraceae bacterium]|nr:Methyltransferase type 11 [Ilumatobacteraceae bacterium]
RRQIAPDVWTVQFEHRSDHLRTSFDADVDAYQAARPDYPDALFGLLTQHGLQPGSRVLEIGPGTGQATMTLLARVAHVVAVEAGPQMAARLRQRVAGRACEVIESPFEHATVDGPFDLAVAATSFHWVDPIAGIVKLSELVPRGAWLALWWNVFRDVGPHDEAFAELLRPITQRFQTAERMSSVTSALDEPARRAEIQADGHFQLERVETFELPVTHDAASLRALFATFSDRSTLPEPDRTRALDDVGAIVDDHFGGSMTRVYLTRVYVARRR